MIRQTILSSKLRRAILALEIFTRRPVKTEDEENNQGSVVNQSDIRQELTIQTKIERSVSNGR